MAFVVFLQQCKNIMSPDNKDTASQCCKSLPASFLVIWSQCQYQYEVYLLRYNNNYPIHSITKVTSSNTKTT